MHQRLTLSTLAGMLIFTTSGSQPNQTKLNNTSTVKPLTKVKITKKSTSTSTKPKVALIQNVAKLPNSVGLGLIESTDGKDRAEQVMQGRNDPFSGILTPTPVKKTPLPKKVFPVLPKLPVTKELPPPQPTPPKPKANLARRIAVEGIMQIGDKYHAIVKLPNDASSRYITEGDELLGGRLLVKRIHIDSTSGVDPTVIFEENGVEVASAAGFVPSNSKEEDSTESNETTISSPMAQITAQVATKPSSSNLVENELSPSPSINNPYSQTKITVVPTTNLLTSNSTTENTQSLSSPEQIDSVLPRGKRINQDTLSDRSIPSVSTNNQLATRKLGTVKKVFAEQQKPPKNSSQERYKHLIYKLRYAREGQISATNSHSKPVTERFTEQSTGRWDNNEVKADNIAYKSQLIKRLRNTSKQ